MPITDRPGLDFERIDLDDVTDDHDQADADQQPADPDTPAGRLARVRAEAARLEAQVATEQQAEQHRRQARADEYDRGVVAQYDSFARRAERDAPRARPRAAVEAGGLGLNEYIDLRVHDALTVEIGREVENAAGRLGLPAPAGIERIPPWRPANDLTVVLGQIASEVEADRLEEGRRSQRQRREDYIAGRGSLPEALRRSRCRPPVTSCRAGGPVPGLAPVTGDVPTRIVCRSRRRKSPDRPRRSGFAAPARQPNGLDRAPQPTGWKHRPV